MWTACLLALGLLAPSPADRVLLVVNANSPASVEIGDAYAKRRGVKNVVRIACQDSAQSAAAETIGYDDFRAQIEAPISSALEKARGVDFIVLTKGVPIRITGADTGLGGSRPSLDSYLASLDYRKRKDAQRVVLNDSGFTGKCWVNRFWNSKERFSHAKFGGYLVTRLDGYTPEDAKLLVANAVGSERQKPTGRVLIDIAAGHGLGQVERVPLPPVPAGAGSEATMGEMNYNDWDADLLACAQNLQKRGIPVLLDQTEVFVGKKGGLMGYASWGSNDPKFVAGDYLSLRFDPGGIAETAVSTSARTFLPTQGGQSLIADLVRARATGAKGYCDEPLLQAVASPTILFDRYTSGWTLAESFYAASRYVGWEDIVVGDPLCAPYR